MARGRDAHQAKLAALSALGKDLSRRARSKCELCGDSTSLKPTALYDDDAPELDTSLLLCARCATLLETGRHEGIETLRFLEGTAWSELPPAQIAAVHALRRLAATGEASWPGELLDGLWLEEDIQAAVDRLGP